jgi:hypothetical protein
MKEIQNRIDKIIQKFQDITSNEISENYFIDCKDIDLEAQDIGKYILASRNFDKEIKFDDDVIVFVTSFVLRNGGHTRQLEDYVDIYKNYNKKCVIIITQPKISHPEIIDNFKNKGVDILLCDKNSWVEKISQLQEYLIFTKAAQMFVLTGVDVVTISGIQKELVKKLYWNLNCDYSLSIGVHVPYITKILVFRPYLMHYLANKICIDTEKLVFIPLSKMTNSINTVYNNNIKNKKIITASSTSNRSKITDNYIYKYIDIIPEVIKITMGQHIHIGDISCDQVMCIKNKLSKYEISENSFIVIKHVPNLADFMLDNGVNILINTFPVFGGLTQIEAMKTGIKVVSHRHAYSHLLNPEDMLYPNSFAWSKPEDLYEYLKSITINDIEKEGILIKDFYLQNLSSLDKYILANDIIGKDIDYDYILKKYSYSVDYCNYILNINQNCLKFSKKFKLIAIKRKIKLLLNKIGLLDFFINIKKLIQKK